MKSKTEIAKQFKKHKSTSNRLLSKQFDNTKKCQAFYAGDFMEYKDTVQFATPLGKKKKAMVQINKVKPYINAVKGFAAQNRRQAKYVARKTNEKLQELYSQYANSIADYVRGNANADQVETQQDGDMLINGYGIVETAMTYGDGYATTDPNGEILMGRIDPLTCGWDPYAKQTNLLDKRWVFYSRDYALDDAIKLFEDAKEEDFETSDNEEEGGYQFNPRGGLYTMVKESGLDWTNEQEEIARVYFYQWQEIETFYRADNPIYTLTNPQAVQLAAMQLDILAQEQEEKDDMFALDPRAEIICFDEKTKVKLQEHFGKFIEIYPYKRKVFYTAVVSGDHTFTAYRNICQQGFTVKFKTGDYDAKNKIWVGMVNSMMEPVKYYSKAITEMLFTIAANSKGGVMAEEGSITDIKEFEKNYAKTDAVCIVASGALSGGKVQPKRQPYQPSGYEQIIALADGNIADVSGIDKTFLGSSENKEETGILQKRRIRQVVSTLACYFDSITLYSKEHARMLLDMMRVYAENNAGALVRILGENGKTQFIRLSADKFAHEYDVLVQEAPQTPEDKQETAQLLTAIGDKLLAAGDPSGKIVYAMSIKYLPLDQADVQHLMQVLVPQDKQVDPAYVQQLEQQVQTLMSDITQADVKKKLSEIALNTAKIDQVDADVRQKTAVTTKTLEEAQQKGLENQAMQKGNVQVSVSI